MGDSNFSKWQAQQQTGRVAHIRAFLKTLEQSRARFEHVTDLANFVARHLTEVQGKPCDKSTLLRNRNYKLLLLTFMTPSPNAKAIAQSGPRPGPEHQAALLSAELKAYNLSRKVERLEKGEASKALVSSAPAAQAEVPNGYGGQNDFVLTCQALLAVVKHFEGLLFADSDARRIVDRTARPHFIVVDDKEAKPFFDWLFRNRNVGGVR